MVFTRFWNIYKISCQSDDIVVCHPFFFQSLCLSLTHSFALIVSSPSICSPANRITIMNITRAFGSEKLLRLIKAVETKVLTSQGFIHNVIKILSNN